MDNNAIKTNGPNLFDTDCYCWIISIEIINQLKKGTAIKISNPL